MFAPVRFTAPIEKNDQVVGACLAHAGEVRELRAAWVVLSTGAAPQALTAASILERQIKPGQPAPDV